MPGLQRRSARAPGSKSVANRVVLLAAMAPGASRIDNLPRSEDTDAMLGALRTLGVPITFEAGVCVVQGGARPAARGPLDVGASGTTLRFLLPWLATAHVGPVVFTGAPRLFERPLAGLVDALAPYGVTWSDRTLTPGRGVGALDVTVDASASSQFVTGLALAAAALPGGGRLRFGDVPSQSYLTLTARWLAAFGVEVADDAPGPDGVAGWRVPGGLLRAGDVTVPGDWSGAAAILAAGALSPHGVSVGPLARDEQGDRAILDILAAAGAHVTWEGDRVSVTGPLTRGLDADLTLCPDLGPVLAAVAACAPGPSELRGLRTLRLKECDRLDASAELVRWAGGTAVIVGDEALQICPGVPIGERPPYSPRADHRMAFAAAVVGLVHGGEVTDPGCVAKTFPEFWDVWERVARG